MDGYETAGLIREREQTARIPIIFLSAVNKETEHLMRGYAMGAVDYVFKPVDPLILKSKVSVFVDLYNMRVQVEETSRAEQELRDANLRRELERLQIARELQATREREAAILRSLPMLLYMEPARRPAAAARDFVGGDIPADDRLAVERGPERTRICGSGESHPDDRDRVWRPLRTSCSDRPTARSNIAGNAPMAATSISSTRRCWCQAMRRTVHRVRRHADRRDRTAAHSKASCFRRTRWMRSAS